MIVLHVWAISPRIMHKVWNTRYASIPLSQMASSVGAVHVQLAYMISSHYRWSTTALFMLNV